MKSVEKHIKSILDGLPVPDAISVLQKMEEHYKKLSRKKVYSGKIATKADVDLHKIQMDA